MSVSEKRNGSRKRERAGEKRRRRPKLHRTAQP